MTESNHTRINRVPWNRDADDYQRRNAPQIRRQAFTGDIAWGLWGIPESRLRVLGEVAGKDVLELGCGAPSGRWRWPAARLVGLDLSERQPGHAWPVAAGDRRPVLPSTPTPSGCRCATAASTSCSPTTARPPSPTRT